MSLLKQLCYVIVKTGYNIMLVYVNVQLLLKYVTISDLVDLHTVRLSDELLELIQTETQEFYNLTDSKGFNTNKFSSSAN